ncbi:MAG: NYN domain-containing protein [Pseudomonadales bacterium]|nr:NYN domain-containing protein [Pseudomonadales bacterium]
MTTTDSAQTRTAVFADVQNIYYTTQQAFGRKFDYGALWRQLAASSDIVVANAYAIHRGDDQQMKFQNALRSIGFTVKLKPYIQRRDGSAKGDWDVGITIDVLEAAPDADRIVLLSGDGDFDLLLQRVKQKYQVTTEVYGVSQLSADSLIGSADQFHAIDETLLI